MLAGPALAANALAMVSTACNGRIDGAGGGGGWGRRYVSGALDGEAYIPQYRTRVYFIH